MDLYQYIVRSPQDIFNQNMIFKLYFLRLDTPRPKLGSQLLRVREVQGIVTVLNLQSDKKQIYIKYKYISYFK